MASKVKALQQWCKKEVEGYDGVNITNMTTSWRDGLAFCALIHRYHPELIDFASLDKKNVFENNKLAFDVGKILGIEAYLDPEDMVAMRVPDRLSIITYVSQYCNIFKNQKPSTRKNKPSTLKTPNPVTPIPAVSLTSLSSISSSLTSLSSRKKPLLKTPNLNKTNNNKLIVTNSTSKNSEYTKGYKNTNNKQNSTSGDLCHICKDRVYLLERHREQNHLYHRHCFRNKQTSDIKKIHDDCDSMFKSKEGKENVGQNNNVCILVAHNKDQNSNRNKRNHSNDGDESSDVQSVKSYKNGDDRNGDGSTNRQTSISRKNVKLSEVSEQNEIKNDINMDEKNIDSSNFCIYTKTPYVTKVMVTSTTQTLKEMPPTTSPASSSSTLTPSYTTIDDMENNNTLLRNTIPHDNTINHKPPINTKSIYKQPNNPSINLLNNNPLNNNPSTNNPPNNNNPSNNNNPPNNNNNPPINNFKLSPSLSDSFIELSQTTSDPSSTYLTVMDEMDKADKHNENLPQPLYEFASVSDFAINNNSTSSLDKNLTNSAIGGNSTLNAFRNIYMKYANKEESPKKVNSEKFEIGVGQLTRNHNNPCNLGSDLNETSLTTVSSLDFNVMDMSRSVALTSHPHITTTHSLTTVSSLSTGNEGGLYSGVCGVGGNNSSAKECRSGDGSGVLETFYERPKLPMNCDEIMVMVSNSGGSGSNRNSGGANDFNSRISSGGMKSREHEEMAVKSGLNAYYTNPNPATPINKIRETMTGSSYLHEKKKDHKSFLKNETVIASHHLSFDLGEKRKKKRGGNITTITSLPRLEVFSESKHVNHLYEQNRDGILGMTEIDKKCGKSEPTHVKYTHKRVESTHKNAKNTQKPVSIYALANCTSGVVAAHSRGDQKPKKSGNEVPLRPRIERKCSGLKNIEKEKKTEPIQDKTNLSQAESKGNNLTTWLSHKAFQVKDSGERLDEKTDRVVEKGVGRRIEGDIEIGEGVIMMEEGNILKSVDNNAKTIDVRKKNTYATILNQQSNFIDFKRTSFLHEQHEATQRPSTTNEQTYKEPVPFPRQQTHRTYMKVPDLFNPISSLAPTLDQVSPPFKPHRNLNSSPPLIQSIRDLINKHNNDSFILCGEQSNYSLMHSSQNTYVTCEEKDYPKDIHKIESTEKLACIKPPRPPSFVMKTYPESQIHTTKDAEEGKKKVPPRPPPPKISFDVSKFTNEFEHLQQEMGQDLQQPSDLQQNQQLSNTEQQKRHSNILSNTNTNIHSTVSSTTKASTYSLHSTSSHIITKKLIKPTSTFHLRLHKDEDNEEDDDGLGVDNNGGCPTLPSGDAPKVKRKVPVENFEKETALQNPQLQQKQLQDIQTPEFETRRQSILRKQHQQLKLKLAELKMKELLEQQMNDFQLMDIQQQPQQQELQKQLQQLQEQINEIQIHQQQTESFISSQPSMFLNFSSVSSSTFHSNQTPENPTSDLANDCSDASFKSCLTSPYLNSDVINIPQETTKSPIPAPISNELKIPSTTNTNLPTPTISTSTTQTSTPTPPISTSTTQTSTPSPQISTSTTQTSTLTPQISTSTTQTSTLTPQIPSSTTQTSTLTPQISSSTTQSSKPTATISQTTLPTSSTTTQLPQINLQPSLPTTKPSLPTSKPSRITTKLSPPTTKRKVIPAPHFKLQLTNSLTTISSIDPDSTGDNINTPEFLSDPYLYEKAKMILISKLAEIDIRLKSLEAEGRNLEDVIRDDENDDEYRMKRWFELIDQRNDLLRDETEYIYRYRQLEYERDQFLVDNELRSLMLMQDSEKSVLDKEREEVLISRKVDLVSLRNNIVDKQETDRLRYLEEDKDLVKNKEQALNNKI